MKLRLKELRELHGKTQQEVADAVGCTKSAYHRYENSERQPPLETLVSLADYFEVSIDYLLGRDIVDQAALSAYEISLVNASRKLPEYVREVMLDYMLVRGLREEQDKEEQDRDKQF